MLQKLQANVVEKRDLTHDVMLLRFKPEGELKAISGQYMIIFVPNGDDLPYRRLYSIASDCSDLQSFDIVAKIIPGGVASEYFKKLQIGDKIHVEGPAGVFQLHAGDKNKIFLATGTGIAPIYAMLNQLSSIAGAVKENIHLLWGLRMYKDVYFLDYFKKLTEMYPNLKFMICLSRETSLDVIPEEDKKYFFLGRVTDFYEKSSIPTENSEFYLCGDRKVVESLRQYLYEKGIDKNTVIFEKF